MADTMAPAPPMMIDIDGGEVPIGTPFEDLDRLAADFAELGVDIEWLRKETPRFHLHLEPYRIAMAPVIRADFALFLAATNRANEATTLQDDAARLSHPAVMSFDDAESYAGWLARETGRDFRLPTEFEWEYAAAGPKGLAYPWGASFDSSKANTAESGRGDTVAVGSGAPSWCGAIDMAGNVEEWTGTRYRPYPGGSMVRDAFNPDGEPYPVTRGGSYKLSRDCARCQRRHGELADGVIGLRLAE